ncbi:putative protein phosphatase 2C 22 [Abeliophyllum distichum]|uniref:PPM-type phosphatase domain-containing protein n=1 Tax=Abeliophyllum distichum TaxID=126358 RepID=A0ABD1TY02_9LAMI
MVVANAGDCRAVLSRRGKAVEMSRDHKPICSKERKRIEASGGYVDEGALMGTRLTEEDEFLIIGCDGLWDVFMSQNAVDFARRRLQEHNDPAMCSKDLVDEALKRNSSDNLEVVVVCFQPRPPPNLVIPRGRVHQSISAKGLRELQSSLDKLEN